MVRCVIYAERQILVSVTYILVTGYGLDDRGETPGRAPCLDRLWDHPGVPGAHMLGDKAAGAHLYLLLR